MKLLSKLKRGKGKEPGLEEQLEGNLAEDQNPDGAFDDPEGEAFQKIPGKGHDLGRRIILLLTSAILILGFLVIFYVQNIEITGNHYCDPIEIADAIQSDSFSVNSVFVMLKYNLGKGKKPPCIDIIRLSLKNPWTIQAKVREKEIVGYVHFQDKYGYFDKDGLVVMVSSDLIEGMPIIEGIDVKSFEKYKVLDSDNNKLFGEILVLSQEIRKFELDIDKIIVHDKHLYLMISNVLVALGDKVTPEQIAQIQPILKKLGNQSGVLFLDKFTEDTKNIIFRKMAQDDINIFLNGGGTLLQDMKKEKEEEKEEEETPYVPEIVPEETTDEDTEDGDEWTDDSQDEWTDDQWSDQPTGDEMFFDPVDTDWNQWSQEETYQWDDGSQEETYPW